MYDGTSFAPSYIFYKCAPKSAFNQNTDMKFVYHLAIVLLLLITGCNQSADADKGLHASATITGPSITGTLKAIQSPHGFVWVAVELQGDAKVLTSGLHGVHIHEKGVCQGEGKPFSSAGGHFDPGPFSSSTPVEKNHPYHLGDLPNIKINVIGQGKMETFANSFSLSDGPTSLFDSDGSAIIIHKLADQRKSGGTADDAGGARQACGVIELIKS